MDFMTLISAMLVAIGLLSADAMIYSGSVIVDVSLPPKIETLSIDHATLEAEFTETLNEIARTHSIVRPLEIRPSSEKSIGLALAESAGVKNVAYAMQGSFGYKPDRVRLALYTENNKLHGLVSGEGRLRNSFRSIMTPQKDEALLSFVRRCSLWGASQLAPYSTVLYLLDRHSADHDFTDVVDLAEHAKAMLPSTPQNSDRALFDNVLGLVGLFKNDKQAAHDAFERAMRADPANPVPILNAAFTEIQFDEDQIAVDRIKELLRTAPPTNTVLLSTAYMTLGAALMGVKDFEHADEMLAKSVQVNPQSATALRLWSEAKSLIGDKQAAADLEHAAMTAAATFENYAEVATLYFRLAWADNQPIIRSHFANPAAVSFH